VLEEVRDALLRLRAEVDQRVLSRAFNVLAHEQPRR